MQRDLQDLFLRLLCLQNQQREIFIYITASGGDSKLDFFLQKFPFISPKSLNGKLLQLPYNIITTCLVCERVRKRKKDRSSIMSNIKEKLVSDISLARQCSGHMKKNVGSFMFKLTFTIHILMQGIYSKITFYFSNYA